MKSIKTLCVALLLAASTQAASFQINLNPSHVKAGLTQTNKWHRAVYVVEMLGVTTSLGLDGASSEYALKHSNLWKPACGCYVKALHETDPLFLSNGPDGKTFNQEKFWIYKTLFAVAPIAVSKITHKLYPDNTVSDGVIIGIDGALSGFYTYAAINNLRLAQGIVNSNAKYGK
jgi:hypothetical protein